MKKIIIPIIICVVSVGFAILSYVLLPESVIIQFSAGSSGDTVVPKLVAMLIPFALSIGGAVVCFFTSESGSGKVLLVSAVGIILFIIMIIVNCVM